MHHNACLVYVSEGIYFLEHRVVNGQKYLGSGYGKCQINEIE
jgi:hypothetical protein